MSLMEKTPQVSLPGDHTAYRMACGLLMCKKQRAEQLGQRNKTAPVQRLLAQHWFLSSEHLLWHIFKVDCVNPTLGNACYLRSTYNTFTVCEPSVVWWALPSVSQSLDFRVTQKCFWYDVHCRVLYNSKNWKRPNCPIMRGVLNYDTHPYAAIKSS